MTTRLVAEQVLHNCRLEGAGGEAYGRDPIAAVLAAAGFGEDVATVAAAHGAALFGAEGRALFADLHNGHITRLWLLAPAGFDAIDRFERTDTPFDTDLDQRGGHLAFEPEDHPELNTADVARVREAALEWLRPSGPHGLERLRPIVIRALSNDSSAAALIAVYGKRSDAPGMARFNVAIHLPRDGEQVTVVDEAGIRYELGRGWNPRM